MVPPPPATMAGPISVGAHEAPGDDLLPALHRPCTWCGVRHTGARASADLRGSPHRDAACHGQGDRSVCASTRPVLGNLCGSFSQHVPPVFTKGAGEHLAVRCLPHCGAGVVCHACPNQRIEPMRGSAISLVLCSDVCGALPIMAHPRRSAKHPHE